MLNRRINFYMGAFLITVIGAAATLTITRVAAEADSYGYADPNFELTSDTPADAR
jgi:hypothetical protein